MVSDEQLQSH
jgi:hypothetical protein